MKERTLESIYDKADLFDFCCAMASPGQLQDWWAEYPTESLPNGGRDPNGAAEAAQFLRHTRSEAISVGLWSPL
jgi:hypothetical protein